MKQLVLLFLFFPALLFGQQLTPTEEQQVKNLISDKVDLFWEGIGFIADDENSEDKRDSKIDECISLFETNNSIITEKSKKGKETIHNTVRDYLNTIKNRGNNFEVEITRYSATFIEKLVYSRRCDCYSGYAIVYQKYEKYEKNKANIEFNRLDGKGKLLYSDNTEKRIEIKVKKGTTFVEGQEVKYWDVLLGNVSVDNVY